ncbi:hypothetical protein NQ318_000056 [Aromia moschata]|uniref:BLOC-1-related complex subunit 6 C-terminal helix domain-containing protein n=1 Tax=Aromia moschata TaxID=1265417 RepID=A0AAV8YD83_9CUCU|nr:hypothetical protein NQ318_000056 [Aromia moschata]
MESDNETTPSPPPPIEPAPKLPPPLPARPARRPAAPQPPAPEQHNAGGGAVFDPDAEPDDDEEISQQMTQSYSEISFSLPCEGQAASHSAPLDLEGTVRVEGNMTHFVAEDLEHKIRLSSPGAKKGVMGGNQSAWTQEGARPYDVRDTSRIELGASLIYVRYSAGEVNRKRHDSADSVTVYTPTTQSGSRTCTPSPLFRQLLVPQVGQIDTALINDLECEAHRMATSIDSLIENLCGILHSISSITADNVDVYKKRCHKNVRCHGFEYKEHVYDDGESRGSHSVDENCGGPRGQNVSFFFVSCPIWQ